MLDILRFDIPGGLKFKQIARRFKACAAKRVQRGLLVKMLLAETLDVHCNVKDFWELHPKQYGMELRGYSADYLRGALLESYKTVPAGHPCSDGEMNHKLMCCVGTLTGGICHDQCHEIARSVRRSGGDTNAPLYRCLNGVVTLDAGEFMLLSLSETHSLQGVQNELKAMDAQAAWLAQETRRLEWEVPAQELVAAVLDNIPGTALPDQYKHEISRHMPKLQQYIQGKFHW
jgi:hypothetical protein